MHKSVAAQYFTQSVPSKKKKAPMIPPAPAQNEFAMLDAAARETANGENSPETKGLVSKKDSMKVRRLFTTGLNSKEFTVSALLRITKSLTFVISIFLVLS
jgi:hypothetical protein